MSAGRRIGLLLLLLAVLGATFAAGDRLERMTGEDREAALLYLPNGKYLALVSLGHESLLADAIYLWAIQFYSDYERTDRYRYVEHVFSEVITELDPHYVDAYWLGALILTIEAKQIDAGLRLLQKGMDRNPDEWILPYLAAWEAHHAGLYQRAEGFFRQAAEIPDAPPVVRRMRAGMRKKAGDLTGAIRLWQEIADDPASDARSIAIAERQVRELRVRFDLARLQEAIEGFRVDNGRFPRSLEELVRDDYIPSVPRDPSGTAYRYHATDGRVEQSGARVLGAG